MLEKIREKATVLWYGLVDNFNLTRKIVKFFSRKIS